MSNVVKIKPKELTVSQRISRLKEVGYDETKHQALIRDAYADMVSKKLVPVVLEAGSKKPIHNDWVNKPMPTVEQFNGYNNIGLRLGKTGNGLIDIDIDDLDLIPVMEFFLPPTPAQFGRYYGEGKQTLGHRLYRIESDMKRQVINKPTGGTAVEFRASGGQTMAPCSALWDIYLGDGGSLDCVRWNGNKLYLSDMEIPIVDGDHLLLSMRVGAITWYVRDQFKEGSFHSDMLAWVGFLISAGVPDDIVEKSVLWLVLHTKQEGHKDRLAGIKDTREKFNEGFPVAGITYLEHTSNWERAFCRYLSNALKYVLKDSDDGRPSVKIIASKEPLWLENTLAAMFETKKFYQVNGQVCIITSVDNKAQMVVLDKGVTAASWLTREVRFTQASIDKATGILTEQDIKCPTSLAVELSEAATFKGKIPHINGISNIPLITPKGRIVEDAWGYDPELKIFFASEFSTHPMFPDEAMPILVDILCDFPFVSERYKAAALAAILTAIVRPALDICPMFVITSSQYSDGKSVLSGVIAACVGVEASLGQLTRGGSDEEQEKQLSAILSRGRRVVTLDNHDGEFRSAALTEALTSTNPEFRVLGKNETRSVPNKTMFLLNGVNTAPALDLQTRSVTIRLAQRQADSSDRKFKYSDVVGHALNNRSNIISAGIALIKWAMGQEDGDWKANHRFKTWDYMIRRTVMLITGLDIAPPTSEDADRPIDAAEEARSSFLELCLKYWVGGMRSEESKEGKYFRSSDMAHRLAPESEQEAWVNILSKRPKQDIIFRCGYALNNVKEYPFVGEDGNTWRLTCYSVKGKSAYRFEQL